MDAIACVGLVAILTALLLLADPASKIAVAKWLVREARAQMAARAAAAAARLESEQFDGELTHAINDFVAHGSGSRAKQTHRPTPDAQPQE